MVLICRLCSVELDVLDGQNGVEKVLVFEAFLGKAFLNSWVLLYRVSSFLIVVSVVFEQVINSCCFSSFTSFYSKLR
jgi:hypothetical protein